MTPERLTAALADRYRLERELGQGSMLRRRVAEATARLMSLKRQVLSGSVGHFSDIRRAAASAATQARGHAMHHLSEHRLV
jgi:hypothetical protein